MKQKLLDYLCDPVDQSELELVEPVLDQRGNIVSGLLKSSAGRVYPIRDGVPRFAENDVKKKSVESFGNEWNFFNYDAFKLNWLNHTVKNTFGSLEAFKGKVVVDSGAGSGMQSRWISEAGASHVIALELSHSVDDVMRKNLADLDNVDVIQCSIDAPPIKTHSITGIVVCHNVIQHTPSVEGTARALWRLVGSGGEFVFNCYPKNDKGLLRQLRLQVYYALRAILSRRSFGFILTYARIMSALRMIPILGVLLEKSAFMVRGDVVKGERYWYRCYKAGVLDTYDCYGSHAYQHLKSDDEIKSLVQELQPDQVKVKNFDLYFLRPQPIGIALRLFK